MQKALACYIKAHCAEELTEIPTLIWLDQALYMLVQSGML